MKKEILENSKQEKIESSQESGLESISNETENVINDINKDLESSIKSGEELEKDFPGNPEVKEIVEQTNDKAEEAAHSSKKNILSIIRESSLGHKIIKGAAMATFLMGMKNVAQAENTSNDKNINPNKIEVIKQKISENPSPESYDASKLIKNYSHQEGVSSLNPEACQKLIADGMENSERKVLTLKIEQTSQKINLISQDIDRLQGKLNTISNNSPEFKQINDTLSERNKQKILFEKYLSEREATKKITDQKKNIPLSSNQKEIIKNTPELISSFESAKKEVLAVISSKDYLQKIKHEFKCSLDEAKKHQETRINNVNSINYEFQSKEYLELSYLCQAYYDHGAHQIVLPYDVSIEKISRLAKHELLHCATMGSMGISSEAKKLLSEDSFQSNKKYYDDNSEKEYFADPTERYVRLKILDMELERLGIKKVGEKLSEKQYDKMMDIFLKSMFTKDGDKDHLNTNAFDFIFFTKDGEVKKDGYELYKKLFNEIASTQDNKTYQHSEWNFNDDVNKA